MSLLEELKRRRVVRVTAAYVVVAWALLQGADTLFPALHLPPWTVTFVAAAVVLGFPLALVLAWAFDVTPGGIARTPGSFRFPTRIAVIATIVMALGVTSFVAWRRRAVAARLDPNAVAILPFRVSGDASLASMREGMVDLLAVKLTGETGPRALDSRTTLSAWRRKVADERDDLPTSDAVQLTRHLGAGQLLLGELVGTPGRIVLNASLRSAIDGRTQASAQDAAPSDSILPLVDRVVAKLLSQQAGQGRRAEALLSESLPAVRAYLNGQRLLRRGDYATALQLFNAALEEDSTFALAALGLTGAAAWTADWDVLHRGELIALKYRTRLPLPDRELVDVVFGFPRRKPAVEQISLLRDILARAPDRIEAWYSLGELYFHHGSAVGIEDASERALDAWRHALTLDSTYMPALEHQIGIYAWSGDTLNIRRIARLKYERVQPGLKYNSGDAWVAALALQDAEWLRRLRAQPDSMRGLEPTVAAALITATGLPQQDVPLLLRAAARQNNGTDGTLQWQPFLLATLGQPSAALAVMRSAPESAGNDTLFIRLALAWIHPEAETSGLLPSAVRVVRARNPAGSFVAGEYCLEHGNTECALAAALKLRTLARNIQAAGQVSSQDAADGMELGTMGSAFLEAGVKVRTGADDARRSLAHADSLVQQTSLSAQLMAGPTNLFALASTRAHIALGDYPGAYTIAKRAAGDLLNFMAGAPLQLEHARLAARLGKREEAIAAYRRYLLIRAHPEPGPAGNMVEQARRELALLAGES